MIPVHVLIPYVSRDFVVMPPTNTLFWFAVFELSVTSMVFCG